MHYVMTPDRNLFPLMADIMVIRLVQCRSAPYRPTMHFFTIPLKNSTLPTPRIATGVRWGVLRNIAMRNVWILSRHYLNRAEKISPHASLSRWFRGLLECASIHQRYLNGFSLFVKSILFSLLQMRLQWVWDAPVNSMHATTQSRHRI